MVCPSCGASVSEEARFCPACGQLLVARADERRIVTVLFADLVGFTGLSELRDPEQVKDLVDRCFERLVEDVKAYGGRVDKIMGDAIVALFGAPLAHEDDAERAVRAALQMQRTLCTVTEEIGSDVRLRIGVNTGEVLVGALRAGGDYTAMGDVVNVANRLQSVAAPGQVVAGAATYAATRDVVRYESLGPLQPRGRDAAVDAWAAVEALAPAGHRPRRATTPLVGRDEELGILRYVLRAATTRKRAHLVLLLGEAGIGKSRLAEELAAFATAERRALVLEGRCVPYGEANLWWPIAEALRQACGIDPADAADVSAHKCLGAVRAATGLSRESPEAARIAGGLLYLMGDEDALPAVDPSRAADEARRSLLTMLEALARTQPLVLILSELHWADQLLLDLVDQCLDRLRALPVVILATARPELEGRWVPKPGRHNLIVVNLDPLDDTASRELLTTLLGSAPSAELRDLLLERSGGNPFFLQELVALLTDAGVLRDGLTSSGSMAGAQELPATLRGLVAARLDALHPRERSALEDAAVLGHAGPMDALSAVAATRGERDIAGALESLAAKDLLVIVEGEVEFRSEVIREVAYETLTKAERARRHAALGEWLATAARQTDREDEYLEQLAHHFGAAAELEQEMGRVDGLPEDICDLALDAIKRAAVRAKARDQHLASIRLLDRALRILPSHADKMRRVVLLERAGARAQLHDHGGARADVDTVMREIEGGGHPKSLARALTVRGQIEQNEADLAASAVTLDQAIEIWRSLDAPRERAEALSLRGMTSLGSGDADGAERLIREALEVFRAEGDGRQEAWALWNLAWIAFDQGDLDIAEGRLDKSARAFAEAGDFGGINWTRGLLGFVRFFQGRRPEALELVLQIIEPTRESGDRWALAMDLVLLGGVRLWDGRTAEAVEACAEALGLFQDLRDARGLNVSSAFLARALAAQGHREDALKALDEAAALAGEVRQSVDIGIVFARAGVALHLGDTELGGEILEIGTAAAAGSTSFPADIHVVFGILHLHQGDTYDALEHLEAAATLDMADGTRANAMATWALALAAVGRSQEAIAAAAEALEIPCATYCDRLWSLLAQAFAAHQEDRLGDSVAAFAEAIALVDSTGDRVHQATARLARGRALEAAGSQDAAATLADAHSRLRDLGLAARGWDTVFGLAATAAGRPASDLSDLQR